MTNDEKSKEIVKHLDAICNIMGAKTITEVSKDFADQFQLQRAAIENETGTPIDDESLAAVVSDMSSQIGSAIGSVIDMYQTSLQEVLADPQKMSETVKKTMEDIKNAK